VDTDFQSLKKEFMAGWQGLHPEVPKTLPVPNVTDMVKIA